MELEYEQRDRSESNASFVNKIHRDVHIFSCGPCIFVSHLSIVAKDQRDRYQFVTSYDAKPTPLLFIVRVHV